ncbi:Alpha/Beta hydrolase protein [Lentinula lateritia]|uniref:Alpha/Beta hydrolase protein n=1 Tax=Lentinula lateritia TaxID=40482 RepID=A0ABQ8VL59_9AGAR|nr:Alpha/Beta hydrolase protein [Lentinula lateritia]
MLFPESFQKLFVTLSTTKNGSQSGATVLQVPVKIFTLRHSPIQSSIVAPSEASRKVLLLLHGYPQNHTLYYETVQELSKAGMLESWDVVIPDLPGYGRSTKIPSVDGSHYENSKRAIAADCVALIDKMYSAGQRFIVAGHDRGARVAYRMAKDFRDRILGICLMEIIPTKLMFERMNSSNDHQLTLNTYHWIFLAQPPNLPETLIGASSDYYFSQTIESWTGPRYRGHLDPIAVASWVEQYRNPAVLTGSLEDYRAGASIDLEHDKTDETSGNAVVDCPLLILHTAKFLKQHKDVAEIWESLGAKGVTVKQVGDDQVGHFLPIEAAAEAIPELISWMNEIVS